MREFRIKENGFNEIRKEILLKTIPIFLLAMIGGLIIMEFLPSIQSSDVNVLPYVIPIMCIAITIGIRRALKTQKQAYEQYVIRIDEEGISREQGITPTINLEYSAVKKITKLKNGGLVIKGDSLMNVIIIPNQVAGIDEIEELVMNKCTVKVDSKKSFIERFMILFVIALIGIMAVLYISTNKVLVSASGVIMLVFMTWSFIVIQKNKNIDKKTRRGSYFMILALIYIIAMMIGKLT